MMSMERTVSSATKSLSNLLNKRDEQPVKWVEAQTITLECRNRYVPTVPIPLNVNRIG